MELQGETVGEQEEEGLRTRQRRRMKRNEV